MRFHYIGRSAKGDGQATLRRMNGGHSSEPAGRRTAAEWAKQAVFTGLLFGLFAEWFYPLKRLSPHIDMHDIRPFLGAIAIFLAVGLLVRSRILSIALCSVTAIAVTAWMFGAVSRNEAATVGGGLLHDIRESVTAGLSMIGSALAADAERWMEAEWLQTSGEVRTLLLLAGWAMLTASIQAQMLTRRTVLFFSVATICYLFGFQWGYGLDVTDAIIRAAGWGCCCQPASSLTGGWPRIRSSRRVRNPACAMAGPSGDRDAPYRRQRLRPVPDARLDAAGEPAYAS